MNKKPSLSAALHEASGRKQPISIQPAIEETPMDLNRKPPSRVGKKIIAGHFDPAVVRQMKMLAMDNDSSIQALLAEALNDLFEKHNRKPIA